MKTTNNYVWEKDLSLNDLVLKQVKEIERLKEELEYTIPIVEHNKTISKHLKEIERLKRRLEEYQEYVEINHKEIERLNNIINELNNAYCKVITKCEEMINNKFYMNDIAIKKYANEIKDICKYYVGEAKRLKGGDKE